MKYIFYFIIIHFVVSTPHINLYYTDKINEIQHDCIRTTIASISETDMNRQIISYCISEFVSTTEIQVDKIFPKFAFVQLSELNVTSEDLYKWSASIDLLNEIFYNCTFPRFGSLCQYKFDHYEIEYLSLHDLIYNYYQIYTYRSMNFTCYTHLKCYRGYSPACLDWSEICDGKVDCLDGPFDEEYCWQLEINQCQTDEYQCANGQCIPQLFFRDNSNNPDCLDKSDEIYKPHHQFEECSTSEPTFGCEDITCKHTPLTSSCDARRNDFLRDSMYSTKDNTIDDQCWIAMKCLFSLPTPEYPRFIQQIANTKCRDTVKKTCPEIMDFLNLPVLFGQIYTTYLRNDSDYLGNWIHRSPYICSNDSRYADYLEKSTKIFFNNRTCFRSKMIHKVDILTIVLDNFINV
ncbi:hypothetical protein I4U23_022937 [Adineta vaga]|nr:hypothetical protein I4U23_022937 [Adineta vaga]